MAEFNDFNNQSNDVVTGVERAKKGKGGLIAGITAGVLVVAVGGGFAAYATSDYVKNQVKLTVSSPENYYTWVNEKNSEDFAKQVSEQYRIAIDEMKSGQKSSVSLKYEVSDDARNMLIDEIGEEEQEVIDIIKNFNDISVSVNSDSKDSLVSGNASVAWNGENLATFDMAFDSSAMNMLFRIPELTEQWLDVDMTDSYYVDEESENYQKYMKDPESLITPEELETEITKYSNLWNECIADVELEKKTDVAISDITVNYTVASVTIDETKAKEISEKFINAVKEDEILKGIVVDKLAVATAEEYTSELDDALADIAENYDENSTETVTLNTYIDPTGCIRGVSFESSENDLMKFVVGKDGDEVRGEFLVSEDGEEDFKGILTAKDNGGKYSGAVDMTADDTTISIEFTDLETVDEKKGYMNGVLTFVIPPEVIDSETNAIFSVSLSSDGSSQQISAPIDIDGTNYGTIVLNISSEVGAEPSMPDKSGAFVVNEDTEAELSDYVAQDKMEEFIKNILLKIGFSDEMATEGATSIGEELYYDYSDYEDDYDYGWDDEDYDYDSDDLEDSDDLDDLDDLEFDDTDDLDDEDDDYSTAGGFDYDAEDDPYYNDMVIAQEGQAYMCIVDNNMNASYAGFEDTLAYNATLADITGNGTYTVKVTADTDGYRNALSGKKPNGIAILAVEAAGLENSDNAVMEIKNVKIDGKEYEITGTVETINNGEGTISSMICNSFADDVDIIDVSEIGEWTDIEVTFEVKGME